MATDEISQALPLNPETEEWTCIEKVLDKQLMHSSRMNPWQNA